MTVLTLLKYLEACDRALKKYENSGKRFKESFINCHWSDGEWLGKVMFNKALVRDYPNLYLFYIDNKDYYRFRLPRYYNIYISPYCVGAMFQKKKNRAKFWPEVKKRIEEIEKQMKRNRVY